MEAKTWLKYELIVIKERKREKKGKGLKNRRGREGGGASPPQSPISVCGFKPPVSFERDYLCFLSSDAADACSH